MKLLRTVFDNERQHHLSHYEGLAGGVKAHENGLFLYKSLGADWHIRGRFVDYALVGFLGGFASGYSTLFLVPLIYFFLTLPRKLAISNYFTFHAELLPHTEQVVFHKAGFGGKVRRIYVDIKNLEKIEADLVPSNNIYSNIFHRLVNVGHQCF